MSHLHLFYLSFFSLPATDRPLYRAIRARKPQRLLELGVGSGQRAARMIRAAAHCCPLAEIDYVGIDPFEARTCGDGPGMTLKMAHRLLRSTGARVRLLPGDPFAALSRATGGLGKHDLVAISRWLDGPSLAKAWFYLPGLTHPGSSVFLEEVQPGGASALRLVEHHEIEALAVASVRCKAA